MVHNFENNINKVEYKRESYEIIQCSGKHKVLITEGVSNIKLLVPESEKSRLFRKKKVKSSCKLLRTFRMGEDLLLYPSLTWR